MGISLNRIVFICFCILPKSIYAHPPIMKPRFFLPPHRSFPTNTPSPKSLNLPYFASSSPLFISPPPSPPTSTISPNSFAIEFAVLTAAFHHVVAVPASQLHPSCAFCFTSFCNSGSVSFVLTAETPFSSFSWIPVSRHVCRTLFPTELNDSPMLKERFRGSTILAERFCYVFGQTEIEVRRIRRIRCGRSGRGGRTESLA